jgi:hypothetical protein
MSNINNNEQIKKPGTSKLEKLVLIFTVISILCFIGLFFKITNTAKILFLLSVIFTIILSIMRISQIKSSNGKLKDMKLPIIGGIIVPVTLSGVLLTAAVIGKTMDSLKAMVRLTICKKELQTLGNALRTYSNDFNGKYPTANRWCDLLIQYADVHKISFGKFTAEGRSNYAINPDAEPNSSSDVVLLFETDGVWNQAGKTELLTVENKESRGYMILFNSGHIRLVKPIDVKGLKWN